MKPKMYNSVIYPKNLKEPRDAYYFTKYSGAKIGNIYKCNSNIRNSVVFEIETVEIDYSEKEQQKLGIETFERIMAPLANDEEQECESSIELLPGHHLVRCSELLLSGKAFELSVSPLQDEWHRELIEEEAGRNRRMKKSAINIRYRLAILRAIGVIGIFDGIIKKLLGSFIISG